MNTYHWCRCTEGEARGQRHSLPDTDSVATAGISCSWSKAVPFNCSGLSGHSISSPLLGQAPSYLHGHSPGILYLVALMQNPQPSLGTLLHQARENLFRRGKKRREAHMLLPLQGARKGPWCAPLSTDRPDHSIREAVMVTKSSKLSRMLPCTAVSFSRKASVSTCSWVHT